MITKLINKLRYNLNMSEEVSNQRTQKYKNKVYIVQHISKKDGSDKSTKIMKDDKLYFEKNGYHLNEKQVEWEIERIGIRID